MNFRMKIVLVLAAIVLSGCSLDEVLDEKVRATVSNKDESVLGESEAWVPLGLSKESYMVAERRLSSKVRVGISRKEFLDVMKLNPVLGGEWSNRITAGEGWFSELSKKNKYGLLEVEEFVFGYYKEHRLDERFAVILRNGEVTRILRSSRSGKYGYPAPPSKIFSRSTGVEEETRLLESFYEKKLQSREDYEKIVPQLKRIRAGWTSAELRIALGGSLYRLPNGLVYLQKALLWNNGFLKKGNGSNSVVILPFGYRDENGKVHKKVIVRAEGGLVTAVFWQSSALQDAKMEEK